MSELNLVLHPDVKAKVSSLKTQMNDEVKEHFFNPKNLVRDEKEIELMQPNGIGIIGSAGCGDSMNMWLKIEDNKIKQCKWFTSGCGQAISSSSILSVMLTETEMDLDNAMQLSTQDILKKLGEVSAKKVHCSILCVKALREAVNDYYRKTKQLDKIVIEGARIIDNANKITDKDIEEAVLKGAKDLVAVENLLNIKFNQDSLSEVNQLIEFYSERYQ